MMLSKQEVLRRWQNEPLYLDNGPRRDWIADILEAHNAYDDEILEIGCNAGSNLRAISMRGFTKLAGLDISQKAIDAALNKVPSFCGFCCSLNDFIEDDLGIDFDIVFSMAVLMHIHPEDRHIFKRLHEITKKYLICAEWTKGSNGYIMPIDPKDFEGFDLIRNEPIEGLPDLVGYSLYVFKKKET